jgi:23S rRNA G2445 N2-methylase RlmL
MIRTSLAERVRDPGFTPRVRDVDALVDLLGNDETVKLVERAIARTGVAALPTLEGRFSASTAPTRARIVRAIGKLGDTEPAVAFLLGALHDGDPKARRNAAIALGHARALGVEEALVAMWTEDPRPEMRRSIAASLGKVGTSESLPVLREARHADDAELARIAERSLMMVERTQSRGARGRIDAERAPEGPVEVLLVSRRGLEDLVADELAGAPGVSKVRVAGPGRVRAALQGPMTSLFQSRIALGFRFPLATEWVSDGEGPADAVARAATGEAARAIFKTWTVGAPRYRIAWAEGGHRRSATWEAARLVAQRHPELVNDPTSSLWELVIETERRFVEVAIAPRAVEDPRFSWRVEDVPAASHPTVAAALARVAGVRADDVVWDPFVGTGSELVERSLLGPYASLEGTDVDTQALAYARRNLDTAQVTARLERADALEHRPASGSPVTLVITNPPMGRRASRVHGLMEELDRFVQHVAGVLAPGGRLVWLAPWPERTREVAGAAGLQLDWARTVDMGGFDAEMQRWIKG